MVKLDDSVFDAALNEIATATTLYICSAEPANHAGIAAVTLGSKASPSFTGPADGTGGGGGRKITVDSISDGAVSADGTATYVVLDDGSDMLLTTPLSSSQSVYNGNTFTLTAFAAEIPDPT